MADTANTPILGHTARIVRVHIEHVFENGAACFSVVLTRSCGHSASWAGAESQIPLVGSYDNCLSCETELEYTALPGGGVWLEPEAAA